VFFATKTEKVQNLPPTQKVQHADLLCAAPCLSKLGAACLTQKYPRIHHLDRIFLSESVAKKPAPKRWRRSGIGKDLIAVTSTGNE